ncbi:hypothetical protein D3C85_1361140 [compost metagenome]
MTGSRLIASPNISTAGFTPHIHTPKRVLVVFIKPPMAKIHEKGWLYSANIRLLTAKP